MKRVFLLLILACYTHNFYAQDVSIPPKLLDAASAMFPGGTPPFKMEYGIDLRMNHLGVKVTNYKMSDANGELGSVSRIESSGSADVQVDCLVYCNKKGQLIQAVNLKPWEIDGRNVDVATLLQVLAGSNMENMKKPLTTLLNGLALSANVDDMQELAKPPKDFTLNLQNKILVPGAKLPKIVIPFLDGTTLDTSKVGAPLVLVFLSKHFESCSEFATMVEKTRKALEGNPIVGKTMKATCFAYIVGGSDKEVAAYARSLNLPKSQVAADKMDIMQKLFKVPFKPYVLMFDANGVLKANTPDLKKEELMGHFYMLAGGKPEEK